MAHPSTAMSSYASVLVYRIPDAGAAEREWNRSGESLEEKSQILQR